MPRPIAPKTPQGLATEAKKVWAELAPAMERTRQLTEIDGPAFEVMCGLVALWRRAEKKARKDLIYSIETGAERPKGEVKLMLDIANALKPYFGMFGLSPADRARLTTPGDGADDPLTELLEKAKR